LVGSVRTGRCHLCQGGAKARAAPSLAEVSVGGHLFWPLPYLGVCTAGSQLGPPGAFVGVVGFLRARGSPASVRLAVPLDLEWAGSVPSVLRAGELQLLLAIVRIVLGPATALGRPFGLGPRFAVVRAFLPFFGGQPPIFPCSLGIPLGGRFEPGFLPTGKLLRRAFWLPMLLRVPDANHSSWSVR